MNEVKVHNKNIYPFSQDFRGDTITIPAKGHIVMDYDDAVLFLGLFSPIIKGKNGLQKPESYKMLEIDKADMLAVFDHRHGKNAQEKIKFMCHVCKKVFLTEKGLLAHIKGKHADLMLDEEARDELLDNEDIEADED